MKKYTTEQKEIIELDKQLKPLGDVKKFAFSKHSKFILVSHKYNLTCLECSHQWKDKDHDILKTKKADCPSCGESLTLCKGYDNKYKELKSVATYNTIGKYQVINIFHSEKFFKRGKEQSHSFREVIQQWIDEDGNKFVRFVPRNTNMTYQVDKFTCGELDFRNSKYIDELQHYWAQHVFPKKRILSKLKRNGFGTSSHRIPTIKLFELLLTNPKAETLWKAKQHEALNQLRWDNGLNKYWSELKIAMRNNYKIKDAGTWKDHIDLLIQFGKDTLNAKYICPNDLKAEHQKLIEKKLKIEDQKKQLEIARQSVEYRMRIQRFADIFFKFQGIEIQPLKTAEEFIEEGKALHHCVGSETYWNNENKLILSAKKNGKRLETIEVNLRTFEIEQSRGLSNKPSKENKAIRHLVNSNMNQIKERALRIAS